jgi:hypothetical protein
VVSTEDLPAAQAYRDAHVKPRRDQHPLRISHLESLDRRASCIEEHWYGEEQGFWHELVLLLPRRRNGLLLRGPT